MNKDLEISSKKRSEMINEAFQIKTHCFDFFFIGNCNKKVCSHKHDSFSNETELFHFVNDFKQQILQNLGEEKKTDELLKKYILENLKIIFAQTSAVKKIKSSPKNLVTQKFNQSLEFNSESACLNFHQKEIDRELDFLQSMINKSKLIQLDEKTPQ